MRLVALVSVLALAACNPRPATYPANAELTFMNSCQAQGASAELCSCVWDRIEAEVPANDFVALERLPGPEREANPLMAQIRGYSETCNVTVDPPVTPTGEEPVPAP